VSTAAALPRRSRRRRAAKEVLRDGVLRPVAALLAAAWPATSERGIPAERLLVAESLAGSALRLERVDLRRLELGFVDRRELRRPLGALGVELDPGLGVGDVPKVLGVVGEG